jgi:hypothetical protein
MYILSIKMKHIVFVPKRGVNVKSKGKNMLFYPNLWRIRIL